MSKTATSAKSSHAPAAEQTGKSRSTNQGPVRRKIRTHQANAVPLIQPKLEIGAVDDPLEREAELRAAEVMRMPVTALASGDSDAPIGSSPWRQNDDRLRRIPFLHRDAGAEIRKQAIVQREAAGAALPAVTPEISSQVYGLRGRGQPMAPADQGFFAPRMPDIDVRAVRIHNDSSAQRLARSVEARAFTFENNVVLGKGEYAPGTESGRRLMAHELTHVAQQGGAVTRKEVVRREADGGNQFWWGRILREPGDGVHGQVVNVLSIWSAVQAIYKTGRRDVDTGAIVTWILTQNGITDPTKINKEVAITIPDLQTAQQILNKRKVDAFLQNAFMESLKKNPVTPVDEGRLPRQWRNVDPADANILAEWQLPGAKMTYKIDLKSKSLPPTWVKVPGGTIRVKPSIAMQVEISAQDAMPVVKFDLAKDRQLAMVEASVGAFKHRVETSESELKAALIGKFLEFSAAGDFEKQVLKFSLAYAAQKGTFGSISTKTKLLIELALEILDFLPDPESSKLENLGELFALTFAAVAFFIFYLFTLRGIRFRPGLQPRPAFRPAISRKSPGRDDDSVA